MILERLKNYNEIIFILRGMLPLPFLIIAFLFLRNEYVLNSEVMDKLIDLLGLTSILVGEALRAIAIAAGSRGTGSRGGEAKAGKLLVSGIYAYTRNPRYLGNFFMWVGVIAVFSNLYLAVAGFLIFWLITYAIIIYEENFLRKKFGVEYDRYWETVPRIVPSFKPNPYKEIPWESWSWRRFFRKEQDTYSMVLLLWCACELVKEIRIEGVFDAWLYGICVFSACIIVQWVILKAWKKRWLNLRDGWYESGNSS